jgi:hypothetical protein
MRIRGTLAAEEISSRYPAAGGVGVSSDRRVLMRMRVTLAAQASATPAAGGQGINITWQRGSNAHARHLFRV